MLIKNFYAKKIISDKYFFITASALIIFLVSLLISKIQPYKFESSIDESSPLDIIARTLLAPTTETLIFQLAPFCLARRWNIRPAWTLALMIVPFAGMHHDWGVTGMLAAFLAGVVFSLSFILWSSSSLRQGFFITASVHILHNTLAELWNSFIA